MANILVYIELAGDRPAAASLETLGEARRIASFLGATLYAVLPCVSPPAWGEDDIIAVLSRHGADKVVLTAAPEEIPPPLLDQLKVGGRMVAPVGGFFQELKLIIKHEDGIETRSVEAVRFVPMTGKAQEPPR